MAWSVSLSKRKYGLKPDFPGAARCATRLHRKETTADPVLAEPFKLQNSYLVIPAKPGCGIGWDEDAVTSTLNLPDLAGARVDVLCSGEPGVDLPETLN